VDDDPRPRDTPASRWQRRHLHTTEEEEPPQCAVVVARVPGDGVSLEAERSKGFLRRLFGG
jgi:hypothetical protein